MGFNLGNLVGAAVGGIPLVGTALSMGSSVIGAYGQREANQDMLHANMASAHEAMRFNERMASDNRAFQDEQVIRQMQFQERMAGSAHQREVSDLRSAGLNPILSGTGGMGSVSPSGGAASGGAASGPSFSVKLENELGDVASSAFRAAKALPEVQNLYRLGSNLESENERIEADRNLKSAQWNEVQARTSVVNQDEELRKQQVQTERWRTEEARHHANILESNAKGRQLEGEIDETRYGEVMRYINRALDAIRGGASAYDRVRR